MRHPIATGSRRFPMFRGLPPMCCTAIVASLVRGLPTAPNRVRFRVDIGTGRLNSLEFGVHQGVDLVRYRNRN
jgi:hypothetical protein